MSSVEVISLRTILSSSLATAAWPFSPPAPYIVRRSFIVDPFMLSESLMARGSIRVIAALLLSSGMACPPRLITGIDFVTRSMSASDILLVPLGTLLVKTLSKMVELTGVLLSTSFVTRAREK